MASLFFFCLVQILVLLKAEQIKDCGTEFDRTYVLEGEPTYLNCPPCTLLTKEDPAVGHNFTWYRKDSNASLTTDTLSRVYVEQDKVVFLPARLEDSGCYKCVKRNSTNCWEKLVCLVVFKNEDGLCYNKATMFRQALEIGRNDPMTCPGLSNFVSPDQARVMWYKECKRLKTDGGKYKAVEFILVLENVTKEDKGNYMCKILYEHNGIMLNISRAIDLGVTEPKENKLPVIMCPRDEKLYVKTGSPVLLACNVSGTLSEFVFFWMVNGSYADEYFNTSRITLIDAISSTLPDGTKVGTRFINISEVATEDYGLRFTCVVQTAHLSFEAYVSLQPPAPDFHGPLIACFVTLSFVIVTAIVTYKLFKVDIVLCYRDLFHPFMSKKESDGKMYDAYVLFPRGSQSNLIYPIDLFVLKVLPEVLEAHCGYKLFIFGRDDLPGEAVANLIDEAVKQSRRLIMILTRKTSSEDSLHDAYEQHIALYDALIQGKTKVILIELEKIDYTEMPESVKYIKQKQGSVRWKGGYTNQSLSPKSRFWKRVRYRMPPAQDPPAYRELSSLPSV